jgi:putative ABC transport system permease protein
LRPGRTVEEARTEIARLTDAFGMTRRDVFPDAKPGGSRVVAMRLDASITGDVRTPMLVLMAASGLVLLIVCANIANLVLARATLRRRELALRVSLGATGRRLAAQLMTESFLLAAAGLAVGMALAWAGLRVVRSLPPTIAPRIDQVGLDRGALLFSLGAMVVTGLLCGIAPAIRTARLAPLGGLSDDPRAGRSLRGRRISDGFVALQVALSLVLLTGAGLLLRSFRGIAGIDPGYSTENVLTARVSVPYVKYPSDTAVRQFYDALGERVRAIPGVLAAGIAQRVPLTRGNPQDNILAEGHEPRPGEPVLVANIRIVSPEYFEAIGTPVLRGRAFTNHDGAAGGRVAIVDETLVKRYWPDEDPIGKRIRHGGDTGANPWMSIIGVVPNIRHSRLDEERDLQVYEPYGQHSIWTMYLVVRSRVPAGTLIPVLRAQLADIDPAIPLSETRTMAQAVSASLGTRRLTDVLLVAFAIGAALLAAVGLYGVVSLNVDGRVREFGVRLALGARPTDVQRLVLRQGIILAGIGVAAGIGGSLWLMPLLRTLLYGVSPFDPVTFAAVATGLVVVAVCACVLPARRAMRADPTEAMRAE